jgi:hypothetical protein
VEELNSALDDLKTAQDTIDGLVEGTSDWQQAIHNANKEVLDLIKNYPELASGMYTDENG